MDTKNWIIMPYVTGWEVTQPAIEDCFAQTIGEVGLLFINQGSEHPMPASMLRDPRLLVWRHYPPMLSLSATWNRALGFVWAQGLDHALVINNDVRIHPCTYQYLVRTVQSTGALFVTATGVTKEQYEDFQKEDALILSTLMLIGEPNRPLPGPDFSCFLITKEGHEQYPFDENYVPAFCEDIDTHRRYMLGGDGGRIFGTGLPYYHVGSNTLKSLPEDKRAALQRRIEGGSRAYHQQKWGGAANQECLTVPFDVASSRPDVTTPALFERVRHGQPALP